MTPKELQEIRTMLTEAGYTDLTTIGEIEGEEDTDEGKFCYTVLVKPGETEPFIGGMFVLQKNDYFKEALCSRAHRFFELPFDYPVAMKKGSN